VVEQLFQSLLNIKHKNNKMKTLLVLCGFLTLNLTFAQRASNGRLEKIGEKLKGSKANVIVHQTIETSDGRAVAVGETTTKTQGGSDGYIIFFNPTGADLMEKRVGGVKDDVFNAIIQLHDGTFLVAGSSQKQGKKVGWLVQMDETGSIMREGLFNSGGLISFQSVLQSKDGDTFLLGSYDEDSAAEIKFIKINNWNIELDTNINIGGFVKKISSAVLDRDGNIVMVGDTKKAKNVQKEDIWLAKIDKKGVVVKSFTRQYGEARYHEDASQIIRTSDNGFAIVGSTNNSDEKGYNAWVLKVDEFGKRSWDENYGGKDFDNANSIVQTSDDNYYIVGKSKSHTSDARSTQIYFVKIDASGKKLWEDYDGGKQDDWGSYITGLHNGYFLLTSATELSDNSNTWFYSFKSNDDNIYNTSFLDKSFKRTNWTINSDSKFLEADTRTSMSVTFANVTDNLIKNVQIKCKSPTKDIEPQSITYIGSFHSREEKTVFIPLKTSVGLDDNTYPLEIEIFVGDKSIEKFSQIVTTKKLPLQQVHILTPPQYERLSDDEIVLKLTVKNPTKAIAQNLSLKVEIPRGLKALSNSRMSLNDIEAGKSLDVLFKYQANINTNMDQVKPQITCSLFKNDTLKDEKQVDAIPPLSIAQNSNDQLIWYMPDEATTNIQNIETDKPFYNIELRTLATESITSDKIKIYINDKLEGGAKTDVVDLSSSPLQNWQIFKRKIEFQEQGTYSIRVDLKTNKGTISSQTVSIKYNPEKAVLHVVSIGTPHADLKYTQKDAMDISAFFQKQPNTFFKDIKVTTHADSSQTDYKRFKKTFIDLEKRYENNTIDNKIAKKDYLIVFISSHGKTDENRQYKILPSDYKSSEDDAFTIDYQTDIINRLDKIDCHKLVFIDACHSGVDVGAKGFENAEALLKINNANVGTTILTSCRRDELSYEDDNWQNGAFTKALLEAFTNQKCSDETGTFSSNQDNDNYITIGEIVNFIKRRVPKLVALQKGVSKTQNPVLNDARLDLMIPLIEVGN
jgi:N-acetylmuramoyl-L-alanine amidase